MDFSIKLFAVYSLVFVALIWGINLFLKNYRTKSPGYYVALALFSLLALLISYLPFYHQNSLLSARLSVLYNWGLFSVIPLMYIHWHIAIKEKIEPRRFTLHFLPALVYAFIGLCVPFCLSGEELQLYALNLPGDKKMYRWVYFFQTIDKVSKVLFAFQFIFYLHILSRLLRKYQKWVPDYFPYLKKPGYNWLCLFYTVVIVLLLAAIPTLIMGKSHWFKAHNQIQTVSFFVLSVAFFIISFFADNHSFIKYKGASPVYNHNRFEETSSMQREFASKQNELAEQMTAYFAQAKPYLQSDLRITDIARELMTNRTYVSDVIKDVYKSNFNDFINSFRVKEAKKLFADDRYSGLTTNHICNKSGFNSYNTFVKAFYKQFNCTPGAYRDKMNRRTAGH